MQNARAGILRGDTKRVTPSRVGGGKTGMQDEIVSEFVLETNEILDGLDEQLVQLESDGADLELVGLIFRGVHTVKGTCSFLEFEHMERVAHHAENLLSDLRDEKLAVTSPMVDLLLETADALRTMLRTIVESGNDGDEPFDALISRLEEGRTGQVSTESSGKGIALILGAQSEEMADAPPVKEVAMRQSPIDRALASEQVRVDVATLDRLMNLVGELVVSRNRMLKFAELEPDNREFSTTVNRLNFITAELQAGVMETRMQPIRNVWSKYPRMVRHLCATCGKDVQLVMEGQDTELDRNILEVVKDPLTHIIRNAVDHGIELPAHRSAIGKPATGTLRLSAHHANGRVHLKVSDDGAGIDLDAIRSRAVERGLISVAQAKTISDEGVIELIFQPGFSTARTVTTVSGRGVGMDVVRANIERIGGAVDISSVRGEGTTFDIQIPLTLAIIPALIVGSGPAKFAVPQVNILELMKLDVGQSPSPVEHVHGMPLFRLRDELLPMVYLNDVLEISGVSSREAVLDASAGEDEFEIHILVLTAYDQRFGLIVDAIYDTSEIVVKPLGGLLEGLGTFVGGTILGDGNLAMILDVQGVVKAANVLEERRGSAAMEVPSEVNADDAEPMTQVLIVQCGAHRRVALELASVARIEEFAPGRVENLGKQGAAVQYRGTILPLISLSWEIGVSELVRSSVAPVVVLVCIHQGSAVGLIVDRVVDIVEEHLVVQEKQQARRGIAGSAVVDGKITDIVRVADLIEQSSVDLYKNDIAEIA